MKNKLVKSITEDILKQYKKNEYSNEGLLNGRFFRKDKIDSNKLFAWDERPEWMSDFVTANNKFFCSHFKELDEYLKEKDLSPQPLNQDQKEDLTSVIRGFERYGGGGFECFKKVGKYIFKCSSYNYRGDAAVLVFKKSGKGYKFVNYISGVKTIKSALVVTTY